MMTALDRLRRNWGEAYEIRTGHAGNPCARRLDGLGGWITASTIDELQALTNSKPRSLTTTHPTQYVTRLQDRSTTPIGLYVCNIALHIRTVIQFTSQREEYRALGMERKTVRRAGNENVSYVELAALPSAPSWARRHTKTTLGGWQLLPEIIETAVLLVSELVTNALDATRSTIAETNLTRPSDSECVVLTLRLMPGRVVIEVSDNNPNPPLMVTADLDAECGRGLMLVQALSKEWGHFCPPAGGKTVYCVVGL